jgi:hypothetical protein
MYLIKNKLRPFCAYPSGQKRLVVCRSRQAAKGVRSKARLPRCWVITSADAKEVHRLTNKMGVDLMVFGDSGTIEMWPRPDSPEWTLPDDQYGQSWILFDRQTDDVYAEDIPPKRLAEAIRLAKSDPGFVLGPHERPLAIVTLSTREKAEQYLADHGMSKTHKMRAEPTHAVVACTVDHGIDWVVRDGNLIRLTAQKTEDSSKPQAGRW